MLIRVVWSDINPKRQRIGEGAKRRQKGKPMLLVVPNASPGDLLVPIRGGEVKVKVGVNVATSTDQGTD